MTPTQKKFKEQIAKLEREGKIPDSYKARRSRTVLKNRTSIIITLIFIWNIFVLFTWIYPSMIRPYLNTIPSTGNRILPTSHMIVNDPNKRDTINYLERTREANQKLGIIGEMLNKHNMGIEYSTDDIINDIYDLNTIKDNLQTDKDMFTDLKVLYSELIELALDIIVNINSPNNANIEKYNSLQADARKKVIELLELHYIPYEILENGELRYYYNY